MNLSDKTTLNLYVNFLIDNLPSEIDSYFEVCDSQNFIVVKGNTTHTEVLNLNTINRKFEEKYPNLKLKNTIDLINYDVKFKNEKNYNFIFYNKLDSKLDHNTNSSFIISDFPWGNSWSQGKLLYFYFKFITSKIPTNYIFDWISFNVSVDSENKIDFTIKDNFMGQSNEVLKSAILDCFDFNLHDFKKVAEKMDLENIILNPSFEENFSEISVSDFIIL
jgi:hypothetical protein